MLLCKSDALSMTVEQQNHAVLPNEVPFEDFAVIYLWMVELAPKNAWFRGMRATYYGLPAWTFSRLSWDSCKWPGRPILAGCAQYMKNLLKVRPYKWSKLQRWTPQGVLSLLSSNKRTIIFKPDNFFLFTWLLWTVFSIFLCLLSSYTIIVCEWLLMSFQLSTLVMAFRIALHFSVANC